jgi:hypothetical protein
MGLLALRRFLSRLQGMLWRVAIGDAASVTVVHISPSRRVASPAAHLRFNQIAKERFADAHSRPVGRRGCGGRGDTGRMNQACRHSTRRPTGRNHAAGVGDGMTASDGCWGTTAHRDHFACEHERVMRIDVHVWALERFTPPCRHYPSLRHPTYLQPSAATDVTAKCRFDSCAR